jgi:hypothetical protein
VVSERWFIISIADLWLSCQYLVVKSINYTLIFFLLSPPPLSSLPPSHLPQASHTPIVSKHSGLAVVSKV